MAFLSADNRTNGVKQRPLRLGLALGWLCLSAACARADGPVTTGFVLPTVPAIPAAFNGFQPHQPGQATDLMSRLGADAANPLLLPLNIQFGHGSGVSFLYSLAAAAPLTDGHKAPPAPRAATYGFSNALAFGHDSLHLNGLMYLSNGPSADGKNKASQVISQALAFENKGWKLDAHYQSIGKDFGAADMLKGAAPTLGLASDLTAATAGQMAGLRGQNDLGFGLAHTDAHGSFGIGFKENDNAVSHLKTTQQSLSLGHNFGHGLQFEAARDMLNVKPTQGDGKALTTTTNHLKLGMDSGQGLSFSAEANLIGDTTGRAEQHMAYRFANQFGATHFATRFQSNSLQTGGGKTDGKTSDQTLGVDIDRQTKGLGLKASFLQLTASGPELTSKTTEHLELAAKDTQFAFNLQSNKNAKKGDATGASDQTLGLDFGHQVKGLGLKASFLQFAATGKDGGSQTKTTEHLELALKDTQVALGLQSNGSGPKGGVSNGDKTLNVDLVRQTRGLSLKASLLQFTSTAKDGQNKANKNLEMSWQARKGVTLAGHWNSADTRSVQAEVGKDGADHEEKRDLTATLDSLRLHGLRNSKAVLSLAQAVSQGKMQSDTRALSFDSDMPDTHVHLEYNGSDLGWDKARNSLVSRAVRVASIAPGDWLHYSAYYKTRSQTLGGHLPDIRDYSVGMRLKHITLAYHYLNGQEQPDGSIKDTVQSHYEADGPLTRRLTWNLQYEHTDNRDNRAGISGIESWLAGFKGDLAPHESIALMLGRPELRVDGTTVPGQTFKMTFLCKLDDENSVAFNGEVTNWSRKTKDTPSTVVGNFRLDVNKGF